MQDYFLLHPTSPLGLPIPQSPPASLRVSDTLGEASPAPALPAILPSSLLVPIPGRYSRPSCAGPELPASIHHLALAMRRLAGDSEKSEFMALIFTKVWVTDTA